MASESKKLADLVIAEEQVVEFLRNNPDFLAAHAELLDHLSPPTRVTGDGVVDLQRFMIDSLRGRHDALLDSGRRNMSKQAQINDAVIALLGATTLDHLVEIVAADFLRALHLDVAVLCVEGGDRLCRRQDVSGVVCLAPGVIDELLNSGRHILISAGGSGDERVFGSAAGLVCSAALIRLKLGGDAPAAMLALGSRQIERFPIGQGSEALGFLGQVLERCLNRWLELPPG